MGKWEQFTDEDLQNILVALVAQNFKEEESPRVRLIREIMNEQYDRVDDAVIFVKDVP